MSSKAQIKWRKGEGLLKETTLLPNPSNEQALIIEAAKTGKNIKVQAFAGTGKTTTIKLLVQAIPKPSAYIAFNKDIVDDVKEQLPSYVSSYTAHSLAYRAIIAGRSDLELKFNERNKLWIHSTVSKYSGGPTDKKLLAIVARIVKNFCKSVDAELSQSHISTRDEQTIHQLTVTEVDKLISALVIFAEKNRRDNNIAIAIKALYETDAAKAKPILSKYLSFHECQELILQSIKNAVAFSHKDPITIDDFPAKLINKIKGSTLSTEDSGVTKELLTKALLRRAKTLWKCITDPSSSCPIDFDVYLKMWQLSKPIIDAQIIYVDEAQDLDPVMLDVLKNQNAQLIWLGDTYQQIYAWRGAINALATVDKCLELQLTETFRFNASIATFANLALKRLGESRQIKSNKISDRNITINHAIISRTNATLFDMALSLAQEGVSFAWSDKNFKPEALISHCQELIKIDSGLEANLDLYKEFTSITDIELFLEEENNDMIARPLALCKRFNFNLQRIKSAVWLINSFVDPTATLSLTTAHKSKGQEWDKVTICADFKDALERENKNGSGSQHEWNLLYVALTRAKNELSILDNLKLLLGVLPSSVPKGAPA